MGSRILSESSWRLIEPSCTSNIGGIKIAAIYGRTSSPNQRNNFSIPQQIEECKNYCERKGFRVKYVFIDEAASGKNTDRPKFRLMMENAKAKNFSVLVAWKCDRLCRSVFDLVSLERTLRAYDIQLFSATEYLDNSSAIGRFNFRNIASVGELERELISERTRMGLYGLAKEGKWPNKFPPYGYYKHPNGHLIIDQTEARLVQSVFDKYLETKSLPEVSDWLIRSRISTKHGKNGVWTPSSLRNVLKNRIYLGEYSVAGHTETIEALKVIDPIVFEKVQSTMGRFRSGQGVRKPMSLQRKKAKSEKVLYAYQKFLEMIA